MKITFISDTHCKHKQITQDLPGGDLLIHAGDISSMGYNHEIKNFCEWYNSIDNYTHKIFIAGNHDWGFQIKAQEIQELLTNYSTIKYLQDDLHSISESDFQDMIRIYGSPWQPEFYDWAFNLPRMGDQLKEKWNNISSDTDILITHGPAFGFVDKVLGRTENLGCELLAERIKQLKPKIHVCGHIHSGHGYTTDGFTHYINASVLNERYNYDNKPLTVNWEPNTNQIEFI